MPPVVPRQPRVAMPAVLDPPVGLDLSLQHENVALTAT
jgi:hypothetical protein